MTSAKIQVIILTGQLVYAEINATTTVKDVVLLVAGNLGLGHAAPLFTLCATAPGEQSSSLTDVAKDSVPLAWDENIAAQLLQQGAESAAGAFFLKRRVFAGTRSEQGVGDSASLQQLSAAQIVEDACQGLYPDIPDVAALQRFVATGMASSILEITGTWPTGEQHGCRGMLPMPWRAWGGGGAVCVWHGGAVQVMRAATRMLLDACA